MTALRTVEEAERLIQTVDNTIQYLQGELNMTPKGLFAGFREHP